MSGSGPYVLSVGSPPPEGLRPSALGVGLNGPPDELFLVFHEDFREAERGTVESGSYVVGLKLFRSFNVVGLAWHLIGPALDMVGYADYSLALVRERLGEEKLAEFRQAAKDASLAGSPGRGLLLTLVFVDPDAGTIFALRAFTLPRLFSDRLLAGILASEDQEPELAATIVGRLFESGPQVWTRAGPGVAVAGEETELDEGDWSRLLRKERQKRRDRT